MIRYYHRTKIWSFAVRSRMLTIATENRLVETASPAGQLRGLLHAADRSRPAGFHDYPLVRLSVVSENRNENTSLIKDYVHRNKVCA